VVKGKGHCGDGIFPEGLSSEDDGKDKKKKILLEKGL